MIVVFLGESFKTFVLSTLHGAFFPRNITFHNPYTECSHRWSISINWWRGDRVLDLELTRIPSDCFLVPRLKDTSFL